MKNIPITFFLLLAAVTLAFSPSSAAEPQRAVPPDFTAGGKKDEAHDWLLGPTGLRGWMFFRHEDLTAASRQILVTAVEKGSPADGQVQVNDVILGVFGKPFAEDARRSFGQAIADADFFAYVETYYNRERLHSALGYQSPVDFENQIN